MRTMPYLAVGVFLLLAGAAGAEESAIRISGVLQDPAGAPIPRARVELRLERGNSVAQSTRDDGRFVFDRVEPGSHLVKFHSPGFKELSMRVEAAGGDRDLGAVTLQVGELGCPRVEVVELTACSGKAAVHGLAPKRLRKRAVQMPMPSMPDPPTDGIVRVEVGIQEFGAVSCAVVIRGDPRLANEALSAVYRWQFLWGEPLVGYVDFVFSRRSRTPVSLK